MISFFKLSTARIFQGSIPFYEHGPPRVNCAPSSPLKTLHPGHHTPFLWVRYWPGAPLLASPSTCSPGSVPGAESEGRQEGSQDDHGNQKRKCGRGSGGKSRSSMPGGPRGPTVGLLDAIHRAAWRQHLGTDPAAFGLQENKIQLRKS